MMSFENHPDYTAVRKVCATLRQAGFETLLAGGCVRDGLLGRVPQDFDVATNATPDQVEGLFPKTVAVGKSFGVILVIENSVEIEVATFRQDGPYKDGRRPENIAFSSAREDALRRDFTINALFMDVETQTVVDYVGGQADLKLHLIRAVGDPFKRFEEDHLRILRALRFCSQLGFEIEPQTWKALCQVSGKVATVSGERLQEEMCKLLLGSHVRQVLPLLLTSQILKVLVAEQDWKPEHWAMLSLPERPQVAAWLSFWIWCWKCHPREGFIFFRDQFAHLKYSRSLEREMEKGLSWWVETKKLGELSVGALVERAFEEVSRVSLHELLGSLGDLKLKEKFARAEKLALEWRTPPEPLVRAGDLPKSIQGGLIGENLKKAYWAQLEKVVKTRQEALNFLGLEGK